ncbi:MAG: hypothetical protein AAGA65_22840 [Actinomycetota bacterium]
MADDRPDRFIFAWLASRPTAIEVRWDQMDSAWPEGLARIQNFVDQRRSLGPEPRLELPAHHPHRDDYAYDSSSQFRYLNVAVVALSGTVEMHQQYGKDIVADRGEPGPLRAWTDFMDALSDELERRS